MKLKNTALAGCVLAALTLVPTTEGSDRGRRLRCKGIRVSSPEAPKKRRRRKPKFSASQIVDLDLMVRVPRRLTGSHALDLKVYTPKGNLYQVISVPFSADEKAAPIEATRKHRRRRSKQVHVTFPVAGTSIVSNSLYGTWKVEAFLDGADKRCTGVRRFVIKP